MVNTQLRCTPASEIIFSRFDAVPRTEEVLVESPPTLEPSFTLLTMKSVPRIVAHKHFAHPLDGSFTASLPTQDLALLAAF